MLAACFALSIPVAAEVTELSIKALDPHGKVLPGIRFAFAGVESLPTSSTGVTDLQVPPVAAGSSIKWICRAASLKSGFWSTRSSTPRQVLRRAPPRWW
jgi:hypothetical protein